MKFSNYNQMVQLVGTEKVGYINNALPLVSDDDVAFINFYSSDVLTYSYIEFGPIVVHSTYDVDDSFFVQCVQLS